jgi:hypothetical protein
MAASPQNNLRIFLDGCVVYDQALADLAYSEGQAPGSGGSLGGGAWLSGNGNAGQRRLLNTIIERSGLFPHGGMLD